MTMISRLWLETQPHAYINSEVWWI